MSKQKWEVKSHNYQIADTGDYDGYWEIVNEKGDALRTTDDYEEIESDLQCIANMLNDFDGLRMETACEINLHCESQLLKMENEHLKAENEKMRKALEDIQAKINTLMKEDTKGRAIEVAIIMANSTREILSTATEALKTNTHG